MLSKESTGRYTHIRVIGPDASGKTKLCQAVSAYMPRFVQIGSTEDYVYDWLRAHDIGPSSTITPEQVQRRKQIFLAYNRVQMRAVREITLTNPLIAARGRVDTIITHDVLEGRKPSQAMRQLFPEPNGRPDMLVVLTTPIEVIGERLDARGQAKTGANSLGFHEECMKWYGEVGNLATAHFQVAEYNTGDPRNTPEHIADDILGRIEI